MSYLADKKDQLLFLPLGGCNEIGMNLNLYGADGKWVMVDLGMTFGEPNTPGVDLMFPDTGFIEEEVRDLVGLVLTHGHEDHIGAVPYLWDRLRCPIYATPFTAALVRDKLDEAGLLDEVPLHIVDVGIPLNLGPFEIDYIPLAHSIAEGHGVSLKTRHGTIFHTGDWKVDENPLIGPISPSDRLKALGDEGVLALVGDSTNIFNPRMSGSEGDVRASLIELVKTLKQRVVITTFASNVARLETLGEVAKATGRTMVLMGRSMHRILRAAQETGYLQDFPALIDEDSAGILPPEKTLIACTGCQGEHRAAMARIARGDHRSVSLSAGDTVIFSSKIIPGNEIELGGLFNALAMQDVNVITEKDHFVHVSGHPGQPELSEMFNWTRPDIVIPVHGEPRHISKHAAFAKAQGIKHTIRPANGDVIALSAKGARKIDEVPVGRLILDGSIVTPLNSEGLAERRRLMVQGIVSVHLALDDDSALMEEPLVSFHGLPYENEDSLKEALIDAVETALERMRPDSRESDYRLEEAARIAIRRASRGLIGKNPVVDVLITRASDLNLS